MTPSQIQIIQFNSARFLLPAFMICLLCCGNLSAGKIATTKTEDLQIKAASSNQYTFIMFWKSNDKQTSEMWKQLNNDLKGKERQAVITQVKVQDPEEEALVKKYGVSRAPMPLTLAIAPNGAITGSFVRKLNETSVDKCFVSPAKSQCMQTLQSRKLVLLCVNPVSMTGSPEELDKFKEIPCYKDNTNIITLTSSDPEEAGFLKELEIEQSSFTRSVVFMAPPGVLVGKFDDTVTKEQLIEALKKKGKGCGVEGCKHCK